MLNEDPEQLLDNPRLNIIDRVFDLVGNIDGVVADIGCGSGYFSIALAKKFPGIEKIEAIDASEFAVNKVIPRNIAHFSLGERIKPKLGSFDSLRKDKYDVIFSMGALHHSRNLNKTVENIFLSLKKGGILIAQEPAMPDTTTHSAYDLKYNIVEEKNGIHIRNGDRFDRFFRECEYKCVVCHCGFDIEIWEEFARKKESIVKSKKNFIQAYYQRIFNYGKEYGVMKASIKTALKILSIFSYFYKIPISIKKNKVNVTKQEDNFNNDYSNATKLVKPMFLIARKSNEKNIYHP